LNDGKLENLVVPWNCCFALVRGVFPDGMLRAFTQESAAMFPQVL
jgi:hypothetical protein